MNNVFNIISVVVMSLCLLWCIAMGIYAIVKKIITRHKAKKVIKKYESKKDKQISNEVKD